MTGTQQQVLLSDRYALLLRQGHPVLRDLKTERLDTEHLRGLDYVVVRSHSETLRILRKLELQNQVRLSAAHFMAVPSIVRQSDLAVIMPAEIAETFVAQGGYVMLQADLPESAFDVSLHWSWRFAREPANQWLRELVGEVFRQRSSVVANKNARLLGSGA